MSLVGYVQSDREIQLWRQMLSGHHPAFEELLGNCYDLLFQYGKKFCRGPELVKDSIQDVFLEVWEKRSSLNPLIPPRAYLLASLRRRLFRLERRNRQLIHNAPLVSATLEFSFEFSVEYRLIKVEQDKLTAAHLAQLMGDLPKRQQEAIYLKFFQDLDRDEIAEIMDIHPQSVSNLLQTAYKWLKTNWKIATSILWLIVIQ